jgi:hypothetical protein
MLLPENNQLALSPPPPVGAMPAFDSDCTMRSPRGRGPSSRLREGAPA